MVQVPMIVQLVRSTPTSGSRTHHLHHKHQMAWHPTSHRLHVVHQTARRIRMLTGQVDQATFTTLAATELTSETWEMVWMGRAAICLVSSNRQRWSWLVITRSSSLTFMGSVLALNLNGGGRTSPEPAGAMQSSWTAT